MVPKILVLLLISAGHSAYASPRLQMHVFEDAPVVSSPSESMPTRNDVLSPARKHRLQTHVFVASDHTVTSANTVQQENKAPSRLAYQRAEFYVSTGYRQDNLQWSIAGPNGTPNIISELAWKDIEIATLNIGTTLHFKSNWLLNIDASYGHIFDGRNQDSDYRGNNKTGEFSRSYSDSDKGSTLDGSIYAGYKWQVITKPQQKIVLIPKVGFSYHSQFFNDTNGEQAVSTPAPEFGITEDNLNPLGRFSGLDSNYDATWFGPWVGLESQVSFNKKFTLSTNFEYHYAFYDATANWNLRSDFAHPESFTQEAQGYGLVGNIDAQYRLDNNLSLTASVNYQEWQANRDASNQFFFADGSSPTSGYNGVNWRSFGANLGLNYEF